MALGVYKPYKSLLRLKPAAVLLLQNWEVCEKLFSNMKFLSQNTWEDETEKWKENREYKSLKNFVGKLSHWIQLLT